MTNLQNLQLWHRATAFALAVHQAAERAPFRRAPGLKAQLLRAVQSIAANIAEGASASDVQFARFILMAIGSANEAETHPKTATGLHLFDEAVAAEFLDELVQIRRMLYGLRKRLISS